MSRTPIRSTLTVIFAAATALAVAQPASALPAVATEANMAAVESTLQASLGDSFGYAWLDGGLLTVGVTDVDLMDDVRRAGAIPRLVKHSAAKLDGVMADLDRTWTKVPDSIAGWYVDVHSNSVVVEVVGNDPTARSFASTAVSDAVRIQTVAERPKLLWNIIGGQAITTGGARCSAGFSAVSGSTRLVITAGHCTNIGSSWSGAGGTLGTRAGSSFPGNDYGAIRVTSSAAVSTGLVDRWSSGSDVRVTGASGSSVGQAVCRSGSTTGWRCGSVTALNQTVNYGGGDIVGGLIRTTVCAQPGDSGGSLVSNPGGGTTVTARGLTSGGSGNCTTGGTTFFQPIGEALSAFGASVVTG